MSRILSAAIAAALLTIALVASTPALSDGHKYILVTGASTGIGRNLTETLAENGYHVYAGARKDEDLAELNEIENVTAVRLDVTKQDQIDAVVEMIGDTDTGLYGLVNNAGVGGGGPVTGTAINDHAFVYKVNVEGVYRVTQAFLPLIIESGGRIVTTGSIAGTLSPATYSSYSGSKHWIESFTDSLAEEMEPHGVFVSVVEPGSYKSNIRRTSASRRLDQVEAAGGKVTRAMRKEYEETAARELSYKEPDEVSEAFMHALFDDEPLRRYLVVPAADQQEATITKQVNELVQLNQWGPYQYSRDELVEMLDAALSGATAGE